jgi:hypothetical protein
LPTVQVNLRRLRQTDIKDFALQEKNNNDGGDGRNTRRRTTSTPAKGKQDMFSIECILRTPSK